MGRAVVLLGMTFDVESASSNAGRPRPRNDNPAVDLPGELETDACHQPLWQFLAIDLDRVEG